MPFDAVPAIHVSVPPPEPSANVIVLPEIGVPSVESASKAVTNTDSSKAEVVGPEYETAVFSGLTVNVVAVEVAP